jgi:hypothetical protein
MRAALAVYSEIVESGRRVLNTGGSFLWHRRSSSCQTFGSQLVTHLQTSRVFHRPAQPYVDLRLLLTRIYHPTLVELGFGYSPTGFSEPIDDRRFAPKVPFRIEFSSANFISPSARFAIQKQIPRLPRQLRLTAVQPALDVRGFRALTGSLTLEFADRATASIAFNPFSIGFTYSWQRAGIEIVHNCDAEQPSLSGPFHWTLLLPLSVSGHSTPSRSARCVFGE